MPNDIDDVSYAEFTDPRRFLLRDESVEDYEFRLGQLLADLRPANSLERRQVELIAQADLDIERQRRIISVYLQPAKAESPTQRAVVEWRHDTSMRSKHGDDWAGGGALRLTLGPYSVTLGRRPPSPVPTGPILECWNSTTAPSRTRSAAAGCRLACCSSCRTGARGARCPTRKSWRGRGPGRARPLTQCHAPRRPRGPGCGGSRRPLPWPHGAAPRRDWRRGLGRRHARGP